MNNAINEGVIYSAEGVLARYKSMQKPKYASNGLVNSTREDKPMVVVPQGNGFKLAYNDTAFAVQAKEQGKVLCEIDKNTEFSLLKEKLNG